MTCPPSLHDHYSRFVTTTRQSVPLRRIGTFGLAVGTTCVFSLVIAGQVLTFCTGAWSSFALRTRRMQLGRYQDILRACPAGRVNPAVLTSPNPLSTLRKQFARARLSRPY